MTKSLADQVGQMLMGGFEGLTAPDYFLDWLREGRLGGVILFARNVANPQQLAELTQSLHAAAKYPLLISIDQEGGTVARLRAGFSESIGAAALAKIPENSGAWVEKVSGVLAAEMRALGINWTYAPVMDLNYNAENPTLGTRSFGLDQEQVAFLASAAVRGFQNDGVATCAKHFPGLGQTSIDTHLDLPRLDTPVEQLLAMDLLPYRVAIEHDLAAIMTTHTIYNALDTQYPATLSPAIVQNLIRGELGFEGVITTDCLEMKAIDDYYGIAQACILGAKAGIDILLISHTAEKQAVGFDSLLAAVESGDVPQEMIVRANERIEAFKNRFPPTKIPDISQVYTPEHQTIMLDSAKASISVIRSEDGILPLQDRAGLLLVEFALGMDSLVQEQADKTVLGKFLKAHLPQLQTLTFPARPQNIDLAMNHPAELLIMATRNAHLYPEQTQAVQQLAGRGIPVILLALRNVHDKDLIQGGTVLCSAGDSRPSLEAISLALLGGI